MAEINIIIRGIAMSYHKNDGLWKVIFPFGECHKIKFKEGETDAGIALAEGNRQIRVIAENAVSTFEIGDNYDNFLDLTASYSHVNGVKMIDGWEEHGVLMSIENGKFSVDEQTETEHLMVKGNSVTFAPAQIGYSGKVEINSEKITVEVDNHPEFPKVFEQDCTIIFDNDCEQGDTRLTSDFDMVYNVVEGVTQEGVAQDERFVVAKVPENPVSPIVVGTIFEGEQGNKNKDPFARGLPCHLVTISKTDYLP
jgi:hypothetical protein